MRIDKLCSELGLAIRWTAFPLHPETPVEGRRLDELFAAHPGYIESMWPRLQAAGDELGLNFARRTHTYNSRRACELAAWAEEQGAGRAFHLAAYAAYFEQGENLARVEVLQRIARQVGLDPEPVNEIIDQRRYADKVDADWQRCRELGVQAIPTLRVGSQALTGFQPEAVYRSLLETI